MTAMRTTSTPKAPHQPTSGTAKGRHHWWRWVAGILTVLLVLFVGAAWYFSGRIESGALASNPYSFPPPYDDVRIVAVNGSQLTLERGPDAGPNFDAIAVYGLAWDGGTAVVSPAFVNRDGSLTRSIMHLETGVLPVAGQMAALERAYWAACPAGSDAERCFTTEGGFCYPRTDVVIDGAYPAWYFGELDPARPEMAIVVHGQNGSRVDGLRAADALGMPVLDITYRNDVGAPADPSGRLQYGVTEWRDLDAAVTWAREQGADQVVLFGQSMGGAIVASFMENSDQANVVSRIVLDAPLLSLGETVKYGARDAMPLTGGPVPTPILWAAQRITSLRYGVDWAAVDYLDDTSWVQVPTLVLHGTADPVVPVALSDQLAAAEPELVTLETFPDALHVESWNFDVDRFNDVVSSFLNQSD